MLICSFTESELNDSPVIVSTKAFCQGILQKVSEDESTLAAFDEFCDKLIIVFRELCADRAAHRSVVAKREKLWTAFH